MRGDGHMTPFLEEDEEAEQIEQEEEEEEEDEYVRVISLVRYQGFC